MPEFNIQESTTNRFAMQWLNAMRGILPITKKELSVLTHFLTIYLERRDSHLFQAKNRLEVREAMGISVYSINNYIKSLRKANAIFIDGKSSGIKKILIPKMKKSDNGNYIASININLILLMPKVNARSKEVDTAVG